MNESHPIRIVNPRQFKTWNLPASRAVVGTGYKPSMVQLPDGQLLMASLHWDVLGHGKVREWVGLSRSVDCGETWSPWVEAEGMIGREHWLTCTNRGTLLTTCHLLDTDVNNLDGCTHGYIHRSCDNGHTWRRTKVLLTAEQRQGVPSDLNAKDGVPCGQMTSRNVVELDDNTLLLGVSITNSNVAYMWSSKDEGETWDHGEPVTIGNYNGKPYSNWDGFFCEDFTYLNRAGKFLHFLRCGPPSPMYPMASDPMTTVPPSDGDDQIDRMMRCESTDRGRTWSDLSDHGGYGAHYPRVIRLLDGRLLMTFTQRSLSYPLGLQAIFSHDDGETWDFHADRLVIEAKTPWGMASGGGFGNTIQLEDGGLLSCYSYRNAEGNTMVEIAKYRLP